MLCLRLKVGCRWFFFSKWMLSCWFVGCNVSLVFEERKSNEELAVELGKVIKDSQDKASNTGT